MNRPHQLRSSRILAIGNDVSQLSSRANVLTQAGYTTDSVLKIDDLSARLLKTNYDLAIVSYAFSYDEQLAIRARVRQVRPQLPVFLLRPEHNAPMPFLDAVARLLRSRSQPYLVSFTLPRPIDTDPVK
jgi:DNA-binding NtrC family response regulator